MMSELLEVNGVVVSDVGCRQRKQRLDEIGPYRDV